MTISITLQEINVLLDALYAYGAGDTSGGAIAWDHEEEAAALRVLDKLVDAANRVKKGTA